MKQNKYILVVNEFEFCKFCKKCLQQNYNSKLNRSILLHVWQSILSKGDTKYFYQKIKLLSQGILPPSQLNFSHRRIFQDNTLLKSLKAYKSASDILGITYSRMILKLKKNKQVDLQTYNKSPFTIIRQSEVITDQIDIYQFKCEQPIQLYYQPKNKKINLQLSNKSFSLQIVYKTYGFLGIQLAFKDRIQIYVYKPHILIKYDYYQKQYRKGLLYSKGKAFIIDYQEMTKFQFMLKIQFDYILDRIALKRTSTSVVQIGHSKYCSNQYKVKATFLNRLFKNDYINKLISNIPNYHSYMQILQNNQFLSKRLANSYPIDFIRQFSIPDYIHKSTKIKQTYYTNQMSLQTVKNFQISFNDLYCCINLFSSQFPTFYKLKLVLRQIQRQKIFQPPQFNTLNLIEQFPLKIKFQLSNYSAEISMNKFTKIEDLDYQLNQLKEFQQTYKFNQDTIKMQLQSTNRHYLQTGLQSQEQAAKQFQKFCNQQ